MGSARCGRPSRRRRRDGEDPVASISSKSADPGTRANIDEFTETTSKAICELGGAERGKAIIILNPAEPPLLMRDTVFTLSQGGHQDEIEKSILDMVAAVQKYVPGYRLKQKVQFEHIGASRRIARRRMSPGSISRRRGQATIPMNASTASWRSTPSTISVRRRVRILSAAKNPEALKNPDVSWAYHNARWTMGTKDIDETIKAVAAYTLAPVADRIRQDVLMLAGAEDHFVPFHQTGDFEKALVNARSVTTRIFDRPSGGAGHCQAGDLTGYHAAVFDWLLEKFPASSWG